jgi:hypothetical protein
MVDLEDLAFESRQSLLVRSSLVPVPTLIFPKGQTTRRLLMRQDFGGRAHFTLKISGLRNYFIADEGAQRSV